MLEIKNMYLTGILNKQAAVHLGVCEVLNAQENVHPEGNKTEWGMLK